MLNNLALRLAAKAHKHFRCLTLAALQTQCIRNVLELHLTLITKPFNVSKSRNNQKEASSAFRVVVVLLKVSSIKESKVLRLYFGRTESLKKLARAKMIGRP